MNETPRELIQMLLDTGDMRRPMRVRLEIPTGEDGQDSDSSETVDAVIYDVDEKLIDGKWVDVLELNLCDRLPHNATRAKS
jgi:hypothetical protein